MQVHMMVAINAEFGPKGLVTATGLGVARGAVAPGKRLHLGLKVVLIFQYDASDVGDHSFTMSLRDGDGKEVESSTGETMGFHVGADGMAPFLLDMRCLIPAGHYDIRVDLDGVVRGTWPLIIDEQDGGPGYA